MDPIGLYLHVPFCVSKCAYCDFYSRPGSDALLDRYTDQLCSHIVAAAKKLDRPADTLYFGGGTPSLLGGARIARIVSTAAAAFGLNAASEITLEANPADDLAATLQTAAAAGVNRLSLGVQSGIDGELQALGRRHGCGEVLRTVADAKTAGIKNISVDLMLGIPGQTVDSLRRSVDFLTSLEPTHLSAYLLKIEPDTPFGRKTPAGLPDEEVSAELYLTAVDLLEKQGYRQYEISNFAKDGHVSRHNLKYWTGAPYLGLGPAAHSMLDGRRFYFPADLDAYCRGEPPIADGDGGGKEEYIMLRLRLCQGIVFSDYIHRFGESMPEGAFHRMRQYAAAGYALLDAEHFAFTPQGFLLSNTLISDLLALL